MNESKWEPPHLMWIYELVWKRFEQAVGKSSCPFRFPVVSTSHLDKVSSRIMVLRKADQEERVISFYSDSRSLKIAQLKANPRVSCCFWHPEEKVQIRVSGSALVYHLDDEAMKHWRSLPDHSKREYATVSVPGSDIGHFDDTKLALSEASKHFAVMDVRVDEIGWLMLHSSGHRRASFRPSAMAVDSHWVTP